MDRRRLHGLLHDVTERRAAAATIRESEQRYRQLVENAHDLIFTCDLDGHLRSINRAGLAATGFAREEIVGLSIPDLVTAETRPRFVELLRAAGDGGALAPDRNRHHRQERAPRAARSRRLDPGRRRPEPHHPGDRRAT